MEKSETEFSITFLERYHECLGMANEVLKSKTEAVREVRRDQAMRQLMKLQHELHEYLDVSERGITDWRWLWLILLDLVEKLVEIIRDWLKES